MFYCSERRENEAFNIFDLRYKMQTTSGDAPKAVRYNKGENYELFYQVSLITFTYYHYIIFTSTIFC